MKQNRLFKTALIYLGSAAFVWLFGTVYEIFSHGVYSPYMIWAFAFPLVMGGIPFLGMYLSCRMRAGNNRLPGRSGSSAGYLWWHPCTPAVYAYSSGVAALTCGSIVTGVLEIYGTTNRLSGIYWICGIFLVCAGLVLYGIQLILSQLARKNS